MQRNKLKIKAPANSFKIAKGQIDLGADEIYLGVDFDDFVNLSYTGRGRKTWKGASCHVKKNELNDIIAYAHDNNAKVSYACNMPILYEDFEDGFLKYVEYGVKAGVDSIIIGTLESLILLNENKFPLKYVASVFTECYNNEFVKFLKNYNVESIYLPHHLTIEEITELCQENPDIEFGVFGHFGCSNSNGSCFIYHQAGEDINVGLPCRAHYTLTIDGKKRAITNIIDAGTDCSICSIKKLYEAGISSIKIVGRDKDLIVVGSLTKIYKKVINMFLKENKSIEDVRKAAIEMMPLIELENCNLKRCKYHLNTKILNSFI